VSRLDLDRRGRKTQLLTLGLLSQGPRTPSGVAEVMGGHVESVARRLRRYRRRGFVAVVYAREGPVYSLLERGRKRFGWIARACGVTAVRFNGADS